MSEHDKEDFPCMFLAFSIKLPISLMASQDLLFISVFLTQVIASSSNAFIFEGFDLV